VKRALLACVCAAALAGCGDDAEERAEGRPADLRLVYERVEKTLDRADREVPQATGPADEPETGGRVTPDSMAEFMDTVLTDVRRYWGKTAPLDVRSPRANHAWVPPGESLETGCSDEAAEDSAFYCSADDTIYIGTRFAAEIWEGIAADGPGERFGHGRAVGDFGVAFMVAHEYGHNVQHDLTRRETPDLEYFVTKALELHADCLAGLWANSVYRAGRIRPGDVQEAIGTVLAVGDFDLAGQGHHGTPFERRQAWRVGFANGDPQDCDEYLAPPGFTKAEE
jgi:predicted metalloprotease